MNRVYTMYYECTTKRRFDIFCYNISILHLYYPFHARRSRVSCLTSLASIHGDPQIVNDHKGEQLCEKRVPCDLEKSVKVRSQGHCMRSESISCIRPSLFFLRRKLSYSSSTLPS